LALSWNGAWLDVLLADFLLAISVYPLWHYLRHGEPGIPLLPLTTLTAGIYYAIPTLLPFEPAWTFRTIAPESRAIALMLSLAGVAMLLLTYYLFPVRFWRTLLPQISLEWSEARAKHLGIILGLFGLTTNVISQLMEIPAAAQAAVNFCNEMSVLAIAIFFLLQLRRRLSIAYRMFLWLGLVPLQLLISVGTGFLFPVIRLGGMVLMLHLFIKRTIPWTWIALAAPLVFVLLAAKAEFRALTWVGGRTVAMNPIEKGALFLQVASDFASSADENQTYLALETTAQRFDQLSLFSYVIDETPSRIPFWEGETYASILWKIIPRLIYSDKPSEEVGQTFGRRYSLLDEDNFTTSLNLPQLVEMYVNFGSIGLILGMCLLGLLYQALYHLLNHENVGSWGVVSAAVVFSSLLNIESNFSLVYGGLMYSLALLYLLGEFVRRGPSSFKQYPHDFRRQVVRQCTEI